VKQRAVCQVLLGKSEGKKRLENLDVGRILLKLIFRKWDGGVEGLIWLRTG
jgi:hypothetical protein